VGEQRGGGIEDGEGLELGRGAGGMAGERFQDMLKQDEPVRPENGPGDQQRRQPAVASHDPARLLADAEQVGEPVTGWRSEVVLGGGGVDHEVEQVFPVVDVAVQRRRACPETGGDPPHGNRGQSLLVGDLDGCFGDLLKGMPSGAPRRACRAHPDDALGCFQGHPGLLADEPCCERRSRTVSLHCERRLQSDQE